MVVFVFSYINLYLFLLYIFCLRSNLTQTLMHLTCLRELAGTQITRAEVSHIFSQPLETNSRTISQISRQTTCFQFLFNLLLYSYSMVYKVACRSVARQWPINSNRRMAFSVRSVPRCYKQASSWGVCSFSQWSGVNWLVSGWVEWVSESDNRWSSVVVSCCCSRDRLGIQRKKNVRRWKPLSSNGSEDVTVDTNVCVCVCVCVCNSEM
jgi:hypothetical protein